MKNYIFALRLGKREIVFRFVGSKPNVIPPWSRDKMLDMGRYARAPPVNPLPDRPTSLIRKPIISVNRCPSVSSYLTFSLTPTNLSAYLSSMTIDTVELRKIQYAQELAAYTMRQWMLMRDDPEGQQGSVPPSTTNPTSPAQNSATSTGRLMRDDVKRMCPSVDLRSAGYVLLQPYSVLPPTPSLSIAFGHPKYSTDACNIYFLTVPA